MNKTNFLQINGLLKVLFVIIFGFTSFNLYSQGSNITLKMDRVSLETIMNEIEKQTSLLFVTLDDIDVRQRLSLDVANKNLTQTLDALVKDTDIAYKLEGSNIVLYKRQILQPQTISGIVRDKNNFPVIGASVTVKGTSIGTSTGVDGSFTLQLQQSSPGSTLVVSFIGYEPQELAIGSRTNFQVTLQESSILVDDVVVTALGIKRSEKALSYNVQQVGSDEIVANKDANFINSLNGKVAGVTFNSSSTGVGGATKVVMRGTKSIMQSSNALYVIDGVPMFAPQKEASTQFGSQGFTEPIADINPEDIESISILNGAAAAALYGSDAANGVIAITTKRGQAGKVTVTVTSNTEISSPFVLPRFQTRYGTGDLLSSEPVIDKSWGEKLNVFNYQGYDPKSDYFKTGVTTTESVSMSTGSERNQTYLSGAAVNSKGIIPNNKYDRYNFTFRNTTNFLDEKMTLDVSASYIKQEDRNMTNQGTYGNPMVGAYLFPRGDDWNDIKIYERYDVARKIYTQHWPVLDAAMTMQNPYWINYRNLNENSKERYMLGANLTYEILDWLSASGRIRIDNSVNDYTEKNFATTNTQLTGGSDRGYYGTARSKDNQVYGDVMVNINKTFGRDWSLQANIGASISDIRSDLKRMGGPISDGTWADEPLGLTNFFAVQNLSRSQTEHFEEGWREQTQSIFASAEVGFKSTYYLTLTGRNDWPSQLAGPRSTNKSYFYPSVGASVILSEIIPNLPRQISYIKLRSSFASVGVAFERYLANPLYEWNSSLQQWFNMTQFPIENLLPERTKSFEIGVTVRFLDGFTLDASYYNAKTANQTFDPELPATRWSKIYLQTGSVRNRGVEIALGYNHQWGDFSWDSGYTFSANRNKILSLANNAINPATGEKIDIPLLNMGGLGSTRFILREGGTMGDIYSLIDLKRDSNNNIYIDANDDISTQTINNPDEYIKLGSVLPDANMAWRNNFSFRNIHLGFMVSARLGGVVYSRTQAMLDEFGVSEASAAARDQGYVLLNGGDYYSPRKWYKAIGSGTAVPQYYTYSATNVRLQEASIGYTIPRKWLGDVCDITVSVVGRNLWMIYNKAPFDPESVAAMDNFYQGIDYFMSPALRNIGFNVRVKF